MFTFLLSIGGVVPCLNKHVNNLSRLFGKMIGQKLNCQQIQFASCGCVFSEVKKFQKKGPETP